MKKDQFQTYLALWAFVIVLLFGWLIVHNAEKILSLLGAW